MSKKSSPHPQAGPNRGSVGRRSPRRTEAPSGPTSVQRQQSANRRGGRKKPAPEVHTADPTFASRMRAFLPVTVLPNLIVVVASIAFALVTLIATSTTMAAMPSVIAEFWLVLNLGPVVGRGQMLSVLPLLPAMLLVWVIARRVYRAVKDRVSLADLGVLTLCVLGIPILLTLTACAMLYDASSVFNLDSPPVGEAVIRTGLLHAVALCWGMGRRLWQALARRFSLPEWFVESSLDAVRSLTYIAVGAGVVYIISFVMHLGDASSIYANYSTVGVIAVTVISLLYLPNAVVFSAASTMGSELVLGQGSVSLFGVNLVPLPPLPVLAAFPHTAQSWAMAALIVPSLGVLLSVVRNVPAVKVAIGSGVFAGLYGLLAAYFAGGFLGVYGYFGPDLWLSAGLCAAWVGGITIMAAGVASVLGRGVSRAVEGHNGQSESGDDSAGLDIEDQEHVSSRATRSARGAVGVGKQEMQDERFEQAEEASDAPNVPDHVDSFVPAADDADATVPAHDEAENFAAGMGKEESGGAEEASFGEDVANRQDRSTVGDDADAEADDEVFEARIEDIDAAETDVAADGVVDGDVDGEVDESFDEDAVEGVDKGVDGLDGESGRTSSDDIH